MTNLIRAAASPTILLLLGAGLVLALCAAAGSGARAQDAATHTANVETLDAPAGRAPSSKGGQGIAVLVNDEPITGYEIEQRAAFIALQGGGRSADDMKAKAEARWQAIVKDPKTNQRFQEYLRKNNVQTEEQARALQGKFIKDLQANMMAQIQREARAGAVARSRGQAQEELIEEKIKLQEARRLNAIAEDEEVNRIISGIAERNNMNLEQFGQHMKGMGVDIATMQARFRAEISWREVVRRRFGHMVAITERDVDRFVANTPMEQGGLELQVRRITLSLPSSLDQGVIARRISEADLLAARYTGCESMPALAAAASDARYEDLGSRKPATIPEPTRTLLLNAGEGDLLPSRVGEGGVELWALCGRRAGDGDASSRETAQNELRQREFDVLAQRHLKDLQQDAAIEIR